MWTLMAYVLAGFLYLLSVPVAFWVYLVVSNVIDSKKWPSVDGIVAESRVVPNGRCNGLPGHHYVISYEYTVGNENCRNSDVRFGRFRYLSRRSAERTSRRFKEGDRVSVYYAPDHPDCSVLEPGWSWECLYPVGLFGAVLASGTSCLIFAIVRSV